MLLHLFGGFLKLCIDCGVVAGGCLDCQEVVVEGSKVVELIVEGSSEEDKIR